MSVLLGLVFAFAFQVEKRAGSDITEENVVERSFELAAEIENSKGEAMNSFFEAATACEAMLTGAKTFPPNDGRWLVRYEGDDASVFTRDGILIMHRLEDGDFPESCGIVGVPVENQAQFVQAFARQYDAVVSSDSTTSWLSTQKYTYRIRPAENPKSALGVVINRNEQ